MQIKLINDGISKPRVVISNQDEELFWDVSAFDKSNFAGNFDMFQYNNEYWNRLSDQHKSAIFETFKQIRYAFDSMNDRTKLTSRLYILIQDLFEHHKLPEIEHWITFHSDIILPPDLIVDYVESNEKTGSRDQTYLRSDYMHLLAMTVCLKLMIPIWGEFIVRTKYESGTEFKEYYAFLLLSKSSVFNSEAMNKLQTYVRCSIPAEQQKAAILGGVSSEDFPTWILALVVIRRLCISDIRGHEPNSSLIPYIYNHVKERVKRSDNNFVGVVKDKKPEGGGGGDSDSRISTLEGYKIKQEIPGGDVVMLEFAMRDTMLIAKQLCPEIDEALVTNALKTVKPLYTSQIYDPQIILLQWVFAPVISPRGILLLSKKTVVKALAATQAILWHRKHYALAGLATATVVTSSDEQYMSGVDSRARITKDLVEQLNIYFPYIRRSNAKAKSPRNSNQAIQSIDHLCELFSARNWMLTIDENKLQPLTGSNSIRRYYIPHNIRILVAEFVLENAKRPRPPPDVIWTPNPTHTV